MNRDQIDHVCELIDVQLQRRAAGFTVDFEKLV